MFHKDNIRDLVVSVLYLAKRTLFKAKPIRAIFLKNFPVLFNIGEEFGCKLVSLGTFGVSALIKLWVVTFLKKREL